MQKLISTNCISEKQVRVFLIITCKYVHEFDHLRQQRIFLFLLVWPFVCLAVGVTTGDITEKHVDRCSSYFLGWAWHKKNGNVFGVVPYHHPNTLFFFRFVWGDSVHVSNFTEKIMNGFLGHIQDRFDVIQGNIICSLIFLNENVRISIKISLKFVTKGPIYNNPELVQIMAWRRSGDKPLSQPMMVSLLTHICVTRPQWVKVSRQH